MGQQQQNNKNCVVTKCVLSTTANAAADATATTTTHARSWTARLVAVLHNCIRRVFGLPECNSKKEKKVVVLAPEVDVNEGAKADRNGDIDNDVDGGIGMGLDLQQHWEFVGTEQNNNNKEEEIPGSSDLDEWEQLELEQQKEKEGHKEEENIIKCVPRMEWHLWEGTGLELGDDGAKGKTTVKHAKEGGGDLTARAKYPFTRMGKIQQRRLCYYYEVKIVKKTDWICIGLCDNKFPLSGYCVGACANSLGINSDGYFGVEGNWRHITSADLTFREGDVIGCGIDGSDDNDDGQFKLFFTKNGTIAGELMPVPLRDPRVELFSAVTLYGQHSEIEASCSNMFSASKLGNE